MSNVRKAKVFVSTYRYESALVDDLIRVLPASPWPGLRVIREFDYQAGRTDVLAATGSLELIAFEAKLTSWRWAAQQAYCNTAFAHYSYVVLPGSRIATALKDRKCFEARGVGLCYPVNEGLVVVIEGRRHEPLNPWLNARALAMIQAHGDSAAGLGAGRPDGLR